MRPTSRPAPLGAVLVAFLLTAGGFAALWVFEASEPTPGSSGVLPLLTNNVSYTSSVDNFPLSFLETLPSGYSGAPAPMIVYLHGLGASTTNVSGGVGGNTAPGQLLANASTNGYIVIAPNTRSNAGFYANTPCGGPQQTDIVDAINAEETARSITSVYFVGFSGGSAGAFELVGNHKVTAKGIATAGTITDFFQTFAYNVANHDLSHYNAFVADECGHAPSPTNKTAAANTLALSAFRFHPSNFSAVQLYIAAGGADTEAPSNYSAWPAYSNVNSTFIAATCKVAASFGEPANCTQPYVNLTTSAKWLDLYELKTTHVATQINYGALFQFWGNQRVGGFYTSATPTVTIVPRTYAWEAFPVIAQHLMGCGSSTGAAAAQLAVGTGQTIYYLVALNQTTAITVSTVTDTVGDTFKFIRSVTNTGWARVELWVVNNSAGLSTNRVTGTWSATDRFCFWEVVVAGSRNSASFNAVGAGSQTSNTTAGDGLTTTLGRELVLTYAAAAEATAYTTVGALRSWDQQNSSTLLSAMGGQENQTTAGTVLPQETITTGHWAAMSVAIQAPPVPAAPTGLALVSKTNTTATISWILPPFPGSIGESNVTNYIGTTCGVWTAALSTNGITTGTTWGGFAPGSTVCFAVSVWNATGQSALSAPLSVTLNGSVSHSGTLPPAPTGLKVVNVTSTSVSVAWNLPAANAGIVNWTLLLGRSCGTWTLVDNLGAVSLAFVTVFGLSPGVTYCLTVADWNLTGESPIATAVVATTLPGASIGGVIVAQAFDWTLVLDLVAIAAVLVLLGAALGRRGGKAG